MTNEEHKRMYELCRLIQIEYDRNKFPALVTELNDLLSKKEQSLEHDSPNESH